VHRSAPNSITAWFQAQPRPGGTRSAARSMTSLGFAVAAGTSGPKKTRCSTRCMLVSKNGTAFSMLDTNVPTLAVSYVK